MPTIERWQRQRDGALDEDSLRAKLDKRGFRSARNVRPPCQVTDQHSHPVDKLEAVLSGRMRVSTPKGRFVLGPGDLIEIPAQMRYSFEVIGALPVVCLDGERA